MRWQGWTQSELNIFPWDEGEREKSHRRVYRMAAALRTRGSQVNHLAAKSARRTLWSNVGNQPKNYNVVDSWAMTTFGDLGLFWSWIPWHLAVTGGRLAWVTLVHWDVYTTHQGKFQARESSRTSCFSLQHEREEGGEMQPITFLLYGEQCQRTPGNFERCFKWCLQINASRVPQERV